MHSIQRPTTEIKTTKGHVFFSEIHNLKSVYLFCSSRNCLNRLQRMLDVLEQSNCVHSAYFDDHNCFSFSKHNKMICVWLHKSIRLDSMDLCSSENNFPFVWFVTFVGVKMIGIDSNTFSSLWWSAMFCGTETHPFHFGAPTLAKWFQWFGFFSCNVP